MTHRHTYDDVLAALAAVEPASTGRVFAQLEGRPSEGRGPRFRRLTGAAQKRKRWVKHALVALAREGRVRYEVEDRGPGGRTYVWERVPPS